MPSDLNTASLSFKDDMTWQAWVKIGPLGLLRSKQPGRLLPNTSTTYLGPRSSKYQDPVDTAGMMGMHSLCSQMVLKVELARTMRWRHSTKRGLAAFVQLLPGTMTHFTTIGVRALALTKAVFSLSNKIIHALLSQQMRFGASMNILRIVMSCFMCFKLSFGDSSIITKNERETKIRMHDSQTRQTLYINHCFLTITLAAIVFFTALFIILRFRHDPEPHSPPCSHHCHHALSGLHCSHWLQK